MEYSAYLFAHFIGEQKDGEQIYFSVSRDGLHWKDLVSWKGPKAHTIGVEGAGCVWAPEAIYDEREDAILVFWASMVERKQRIYAAYTKDFQTFGDPFLFLEKENHVIDSTIIRTEEGYYRYTKDETTKNIVADFAKTLKPEDFKEIPSETLSELYGVEGPEIFKFNDREEWCLIADRFATGKGYLPLVTKSLKTGAFTVLNDTQFDMGVTKKRHGGIIPITEEEYQSLCK